MAESKRQPKSESVLIRLGVDEKRSFKDAADVCGIPLSSWIRERLRRAAIRDLENVGRFPEFLKE